MSNEERNTPIAKRAVSEVKNQTEKGPADLHASGDQGGADARVGAAGAAFLGVLPAFSQTLYAAPSHGDMTKTEDATAPAPAEATSVQTGSEPILPSAEAPLAPAFLAVPEASSGASAPSRIGTPALSSNGRPMDTRAPAAEAERDRGEDSVAPQNIGIVIEEEISADLAATTVVNEGDAVVNAGDINKTMMGDGTTFFVEDGFSDGVINGSSSSGATDRIDLSGLSSAVTVTYSGDMAGEITDGAGTITFADIEEIRLTEFDDVVAGQADGAGMTIEAGGGRDTITGGSAGDTLYGDAGADMINGGAGNDHIYGGTGADFIRGGADADVIHLQNDFGVDVIVGGETGWDNDAIDLRGMDRGVTITYSGGEDGQISEGTSTASFSQIESLYGSQGGDTIDLFNSWLGVIVDASDGDDVILNTHDNSEVFGGAGNDTISGISATSGGNSFIDGGDGDDVIDGDGGADYILGGSGSDTIEAGYQGNNGHNDTIFGGTGDDVITSSELSLNSRDQLYGEAGNDYINALSGTNTLDGGTGDDTLDGGFGNDIIRGGADADTFIVAQNGGNDTISGGEDGIDADIIDMSGASSGATVTYSGSEAGQIDLAGASHSFSEIEQMRLTDSADDFDASNDAVGVSVEAGGGDDTLRGGTGDDLLDGGEGDNLFVMSSMQGDDTIAGGGATWTDTLELAGEGSGAPVVSGMTVDGDGWTLMLDNGHSVSAVNGSDLDLSTDASGLVTFDDGGTVTFTDIDRIAW